MNAPIPIEDKDSGSKLTITERMVADLWNEVLRNITMPQPNDNFFAVGGDSMAMVTLEFRIKEEIGVELPPGTVLSAPTLRELSSTIDSLARHRSQRMTLPADSASSE